MNDHEARRHTPAITTDGQPAGSIAWDSTTVTADPEPMKRHLTAVAQTPAIRQAWSLTLAAMRLDPGQSVLDLGCGTGAFLPVLSGAIGPAGRIVGLDHATPFLAEARSVYEESGGVAPLELVRGDAQALPFARGIFDAAHTERVLIHVRDVDQTLRELARVVNPGGWVVSVEPDLAGLRVDHPDQHAMRSVISGFCASIRNPATGLELSGRMAACGFTEVEAHVVTEVERTYPADVAVFYRAAADVAVARGWLTAEDASVTLDTLDQAGRDGRFTSYSSMFVVAGRSPGRD